MAGAVFGRERELRAVEKLLADRAPCARALLIDGEAGIGKTTVWLAGIERAEQDGYRVLRCRPAETEEGLPFVALGDLVEPVLDDTLDGVAAPQRAALEAALLRVQPDGGFGRLAVSRAGLSVLTDVARREPTLLAIDDVQWLDPATADVLSFAIRRLRDLPVRLLVARRSTRDEPAPLGLARALDGGNLELLRVGPLPVGDLDRLLRATLDVRLPRPRLVELHRRSQGNPFYALEIARAATRSGGADLQIPESLSTLVRDRLDELSPPGREAALFVSASAQASVATIERAVGVAGIADAVRQDVLVMDGDRVRFSHPLLSSITYESAAPWERREVHRRLAEVVADPEERARHLSLATEGADEGVAREIEEAAGLAARRGAPEAAAQLAEQAARLTPASATEDRRRRLMLAADHHIASGDPARGGALLQQLIAVLPAGPARAAVLWRLADAGNTDLDGSIRLSEQALAEAGEQPALSAEIHTALGIFTWIAGQLERSAEHTRQAATFAELAGDDQLVAISLGEVCHAEVVLGKPVPEQEMARAVALEEDLDGVPYYLRPSYQLGVMRMYTDDLERARPLLRAELRRIDSLGDEAARPGVLFRLAELELRIGSWAESARYAREAMEIALQAGIDQEQSVGLMVHGLVQAHLGNLDDATASAETALAITEETGDRVVAIRCLGVLGFIELSRDDPVAALHRLSPARDELRRLGVGELSISQVVNNEIEALVAVGRLTDAEETIGYVEDKGRSSGRAWHRAVGERGLALVAAARGDFESARRHLELALEAHERLPQPFELGRTQLARGQIERRERRRGPARESLTAALQLFDQLGAPLWAEKAAAELARIPGRARGSGELTETERRVAELVAEGLSNKEVAAKLFVTVRTVEANLSKVYAKVGVRSRTELASRLSRPPAP